MKISYKPKGVCSRMIHAEVEDGIVKSVDFIGGCSGNTQGVSRLAEGRPVEEVVKLLGGIRCGMKATSCPDQLALALEQARE